MFAELLWVHSVVRRDLTVVEQLACRRGRRACPGEAVEAALSELKTSGPLWQLKVGRLRYCRFVHAHHGAEDVLLFPALRGRPLDRPGRRPPRGGPPARYPTCSTPSRPPPRALTDTNSGDARRRVIEGLQDLRRHLLEHLEYEELSAGPAMRRLIRSVT